MLDQFIPLAGFFIAIWLFIKVEVLEGISLAEPLWRRTLVPRRVFSVAALSQSAIPF